jgi:hypothetical protein
MLTINTSLQLAVANTCHRVTRVCLPLLSLLSVQFVSLPAYSQVGQPVGDPGEPPATEARQTAQTQMLGDPGEAPVPTREAGAGAADIPSPVCRLGFVQQGAFLCMTGTRGPTSFANAVVECMDSGGRVADYHDWRFRIFRGDGLPAPVGFWLGPLTADNRALFVNSPNVADFDGETSRFDSRNFVCAHDRG